MNARWFHEYRASYLPHDIVAGIVVAALSIPVAMGYAQVAGLPPIYGLYASILPPIVYALLTRSRDIVFGMDSATVAAVGGVVASSGIALGSPEAIAYIPLLTLCTAGILVLFSLVRFGKVMHFIPTPVMHGFIAGISVSVIIDQIPLLAGTKVSIGSSFITNIVAIAASLPSANPASAMLALATLAILAVCYRRAPKVPASLLVLAAATLFTAIFHLDSQGVAVLGTLPAALPSFVIPSFAGVDVPDLLSDAFTVALVSAAESLLTVDLFAMRHANRGNENHELLAFGIADVFSALIGGTPCSASLSRSAAGESAGGRSQVVSLVSALVIALVVFFLAPYLYYLPQPVLGAIVVAALAQVVDTRKIARYANRMRVEFGIFVLTALFVMFFGPIPGVINGVVLSLVTLLYRKESKRHRKYLGIVTTTGNIKPERKVSENTMIVRIDGMISFVNITSIADDLLERIEQEPKTFILDISGVIGLDTTATDRIVQLIDLMQEKGIDVRIVRSVALSQDHYTRFELEHIFHQAHIYPSVQAALGNIPQRHQRVVKYDIDGEQVSDESDRDPDEDSSTSAGDGTD